jgi:hypothetical protein
MTIGRVALATVVGMLTLALGSVQVAAASSTHHALHAKKKKGKANVLVHCASVTIKCKTHAGTTGPAGATGASGPAGAPGNGVPDRLRWKGAVLSSTSTPTTIELSPFEQAAGQDERLLGLATVTFPTGECEVSSKKENLGEFKGLVSLDGQVAGVIQVGAKEDSYSPGAPVTVPIVWTSAIEEIATITGLVPISATAQTHTLTVAAEDDCNASGATHFTVDSVAVDVLSAT